MTPMTDAEGLRIMQRTEEARGCHHLAQALGAGADALDRLAQADEALDDAFTAGMGQALGRDYADDLMRKARQRLGLKEQQ